MRRLAVAFLLSTLPLLSVGTCDARAKWEGALAAKGGREKLESVRTFFWSGEMTWWQGLARRKFLNQMLYVFPNFSWSYGENGDPRLGKGASHTYYDRGYSLRTEDLRRDFYESPIPKEPYANELPVLLLETPWMKPELKSCVVDDSKQEIVIAAVLLGLEYDFHFARNERLPSRIVVHDHDGAAHFVNTEWKLTDYRPSGAINLPAMLRKRAGPRDAPMVLNLKMRYEINPEVPSALIDSDPTQTMGPDGWRKVRSSRK